MKKYELTYLISAALNFEEVKKIVGEVNSYIVSKGGEIVDSPLPMRKTLIHPIKKQGSAYLASLEFYFNQEKISQLKEIEKRKEILRTFLTEKIRVKPKETKFKPVKLKKVSPKKVEELEKIEKKLDEILGI